MIPIPHGGCKILCTLFNTHRNSIMLFHFSYNHILCIVIFLLLRISETVFLHPFKELELHFS